MFCKGLVNCSTWRCSCMFWLMAQNIDQAKESRGHVISGSRKMLSASPFTGTSFATVVDVRYLHTSHTLVVEN